VNNPLISVVVTTKNEQENIENCLKSIKNQSYKNYEIIVVDNFSTDETKKIARKYSDNF
jgi:glycosyltransferase involved in cell wall biosynthesis